MTPDLITLREAALELAPADRLALANELRLSVGSEEDKLEALRAAIQLGEDDLARGDYDDVALDDLPAYLASLSSDA